MFGKIKKFVSKNYITILVVIILTVAAFARLWRIEDYLVFLGDEGRDVLVVREILQGQLTFLGPRASAGDFYTGPIYYYMMAPFLFLSNYNPVGPAIMIALFSIATVYLIFRFGKEWIGLKGAIAAAALYAISPLVIQYARSSWNPNPMPFFSILILYLLYRGIKKFSLILFTVTGILFGIAFQLHYIEVFMGIIIFFFILLGNIVQKTKKMVLTILKEYALLFVGFVVGFSPFLAFEVAHGFPNTRTVLNFVIHGDPTAPDLTKLTPPEVVANVFFRIFARLVVNFPPDQQLKMYSEQILQVWGMAAIIIGIISTILIIKVKDNLARLLLALWLILGVGLFALYKKPIYDYYFAFMFPLPFLLVGNVVNLSLEAKYKAFVVLGAVLLIGLLLINFRGDPLMKYPNKQYRQVEKVSKFILDKTGGRPYNFALLSGGNSDHAYRYIFEVNGRPPVTILNPQIDPARKSVTDQLFIVCEMDPCQPEGASLWEVAGFGRAQISDAWKVSVLQVYKLKHFKENN